MWIFPIILANEFHASVTPLGFAHCTPHTHSSRRTGSVDSLIKKWLHFIWPEDSKQLTSILLPSARKENEIKVTFSSFFSSFSWFHQTVCVFCHCSEVSVCWNFFLCLSSYFHLLLSHFILRAVVWKTDAHNAKLRAENIIISNVYEKISDKRDSVAPPRRIVAALKTELHARYVSPNAPKSVLMRLHRLWSGCSE